MSILMMMLILGDVTENPIKEVTDASSMLRKRILRSF